MMSRNKIKSALVVGGIILSSLTTIGHASKQSTNTNDQPVFGRYEVVNIAELGNVPINAKIDTGAYTASLNAKDIEYYEKEGDKWVRFTPVVDDKELATKELPLVKVSRIKQRVEEGDNDDVESARRPGVELTVCIGEQKKVIEVNLTNRDHFTYPLLVGAKALRQFDALVDAGRKYIADPECK